MSRPSHELTVTTALVPALLRFARGRGVAVRDVVGRFDLSTDAAQADEAMIAPSTITSLFEAVADLCGEPWVGLRLAAEPLRERAYAPLLLALRRCRAVADALDALASHATSVHPHLRVERNRAVWSQAHVGARRGAGRHVEEYALAFVLTRCREACVATSIHAEAVWFAHPRPRDVLPLQRFFGTDSIMFGADQTALTLPVSALDLPLDAQDAPLPPSTDPAPSPARAESMRSLVAASLPELLARGATLEAVARSLGMSDRTLQRRLEGEGTSFLEIQDAVREARARELLRDLDVSLLDVADRLGFSDLATFSRAFKRWTGHPPGMFRRKSIA